MADIKSITVLTELQDFLDKLPATPCPENPGNQDFCTVCKRLNREVASSCKYSGLEIDAEKVEEESEPEPKSVEFKPVSDDVETKSVVPPESDEEFPMIEIVKPSTTPKKPLEMELLDDVAIEFEVMGEGDEPVEVEALEVEPLDEDELEDESGDISGDEEDLEVVQFESVEAIEPGMELEEATFEPSPSSPDTKIVPPPPVLKPTQQGPLPPRRIKLKNRPPMTKVPTSSVQIASKPIPKRKPAAKRKAVPKRKPVAKRKPVNKSKIRVKPRLRSK
jgi:hypothetical protein